MSDTVHTPDTVRAQMQADIDAANAATGGTAATVHDAVTELIGGFGAGGADNTMFISALDGTLTDLVLPDGLVNLKTVLNKNTSLKSITFPDTLETISETVFAYLSTLDTPIVFPAGLKSIGNNVFNSCYKIPSVTFKGTPESIHKGAFTGAVSNGVINCPWAEGEVADAPWGATTATINYNYKEG